MLDAIRQYTKDKFLAAKRLDHFVNSERFAEAFAAASDLEKTDIQSLIEQEQYDVLKTFIHVVLTKELNKKTVAQLRQLARKYKVKYWNELRKEDLIHEITQIESLRDSDLFQRKPIQAR